MLSEKYRPKSLEAMVGNEEARIKLRAWLKKWRSGSKAALLVGPPGIGKTTTVHLLAEEGGFNLVELNASDARTRDKLSKRLGEIISSTSLMGERSLIFLDEVDGLAGRADYGAIDFIKDAVRKSENPVVMAANDPDADEVKKLTSVSSKIAFEPPAASEVLVFLRKVAGQEGLRVADDQLFSIAESSKGDLRYALNALQGGSGGKDQELTAAQSLNAFFEAGNQQDAVKALRAYPGQPRDKLRGLFSSVITAKLMEEKRAKALEVLSRADLIMGRILRGNAWRMLRYLNPMLATELRRTIAGERVHYSAEGVPWMLQLRIWNDSRKIKEISGLAGRRLGNSMKGSLVADFPYLMRLCSGKEFREEFARSLNLDEPLQTFLVKESAKHGPAKRR
ncbi:MAG: AAA family ATPase [Nitrososphaerales archaeon]|nr:AAA family ATPase [Nitrososphaerales archaeon]